MFRMLLCCLLLLILSPNGAHSRLPLFTLCLLTSKSIGSQSVRLSWDHLIVCADWGRGPSIHLPAGPWWLNNHGGYGCWLLLRKL